MKNMIAMLGTLALLSALVGCGTGSAPREPLKTSSTVKSVPASATGSAPTSSSATDVGALPPHTVASDTDISVGSLSRRRIEIHVTNPDLSKEDAIRLIEAYRGRAGTSGQVSVRKPDPAGVLQPWAVDNMEGRGVEFNDALFVALPKEPPLKPAPGEKASVALKHYNARDKYLTADLMTAWTRKQVETAFGKDGGKAAKEVWPLGKDTAWVEVKYVFPDKSWLFVGYAEDTENLGGGQATWRMQDIFPPSEAR